MLISLDNIIQKYNLKIKSVLHVGAHECEEMEAYLKAGLSYNNVIWIEAQPNLVSKMKVRNPNYKIYHKVVSDEDNKEVEFIVTNNVQSSSILELGEHKKYHPSVIESYRFKTKTTTLDTFVKDENLNMENINFLNMDIQGAEFLALKGMKNNLKYLDYIYLEVNDTHVYENCGLISDIDDFLREYGFIRVETCMTDFHWGDALYIRK